MERQREAGGLMEKEGSVDVKRGGLSFGCAGSV